MKDLSPTINFRKGTTPVLFIRDLQVGEFFTYQGKLYRKINPVSTGASSLACNAYNEVGGYVCYFDDGFELKRVISVHIEVME